jgi:hypothetical protein
MTQYDLDLMYPPEETHDFVTLSSAKADAQWEWEEMLEQVKPMSKTGQIQVKEEQNVRR